MPNSLVKFTTRTDGNGRGNLYWGRADRDGLPYRGAAPPLFTEEEFESRTVRVPDAHNGTYRTWVPEENKKFLDVLDMIYHNWATCIYVERWKTKVKIDGRIVYRHVVYVEWVEWYLEDGSRTQAGYGQPLEYSHGSAHGPQHPLASPTGVH